MYFTHLILLDRLGPSDLFRRKTTNQTIRQLNGVGRRLGVSLGLGLGSHGTVILVRQDLQLWLEWGDLGLDSRQLVLGSLQLGCGLCQGVSLGSNVTIHLVVDDDVDYLLIYISVNIQLTNPSSLNTQSTPVISIPNDNNIFSPFNDATSN